MSKQYPTLVEGENGWSEWVRPARKGYRLACCDCALVHNLEFKLVERAEGTVILFRAQRNQRSTGQLRRWERTRKASKQIDR